MTINDVPICRYAYEGPIMEVHFLREAEWEGPALYPYELQLARFSNFNATFIGEDDVEAFIESKLPEYPETKLVTISYHKP